MRLFSHHRPQTDLRRLGDVRDRCHSAMREQLVTGGSGNIACEACHATYTTG